MSNEENRIFKCPECEELSPENDWIDCEVYCAECSEHGAIQCPHCDYRLDLVESNRTDLIPGYVKPPKPVFKPREIKWRSFE